MILLLSIEYFYFDLSNLLKFYLITTYFIFKIKMSILYNILRVKKL